MYLVLTYKGTVELERLGTTIGANQRDYRMDFIFFPSFYLAQTLILVLVWFVCPPALHCSFLKLLYTHVTVSLEKGFGSNGKQHHKHIGSETQSHTR